MDGSAPPQAGQDDDTTPQGRAAVRALLIRRCDEAGLVRPRNVTQAAHEAMQARLVEALDHMSPDNLVTLADLVIEAAMGPNVWPAEATVRSWGHALQRRPLGQHRIVTSWLASVKGPEAEAGGWLLELYRFLARHRRPPMEYDISQLRLEAQDNARTLELIAGRVERGTASREDRAFAERHAADLAAARAAVDQGRAARSGAAHTTTIAAEGDAA